MENDIFQTTRRHIPENRNLICSLPVSVANFISWTTRQPAVCAANTDTWCREYNAF